MNLRRWLTLSLILAVLVVGLGLRLLVNRPPGAVLTIYYPDREGRRLVGVARAVKAATAETAVAELLAGPAPGGPLAAALPASSRVVLSGPATDLVVAVTPSAAPPGEEALARTLLGLTGMQSVTVSGRRWTAADVAPGTGQTLVYYPYRGVPVPVIRSLPATQGVQGMQAAVADFLTDAPPQGLYGPPPGISLVDLTVKGDAAHVRFALAPDLARTLAAGGWNFSPYYMSVIYTLTEFPGIHRVQFEFTGLSAAALQQCRTPLSIPLSRPEPEKGRS
ncbi:MAG TPA: GerMN domain-containing protein [Symbiobacteriaceae bacterium]|jgi:hypothetical protein